jgi:hypothetical protein
MKQIIKRATKRTLSIVLCLMMVFSTMLIGSITANAATATLYLKPKSSWSGSYGAYYWSDSNTGMVDWNNMTAMTDSDNDGIYEISYDTSATKVIFRYNNWTAQYTEQTIPSDCNYFDANTDTWSTYSSSNDGATKVTNADLLSVLKEEKVMFYFGEPQGWNQSTMYLFNDSNCTTEYAHNSTNDYTISSTTYKLATFCQSASTTYFMGHSNYSPYGTKPSAGATYILTGSTVSTGFTNVCTATSGNRLYSYNNGATLTANTTATSSITEGSTLAVSTANASSGKLGKSTVGNDNTVKYYIVADGSSDYYEYKLSDGTLDTSELATGTYTLKTVLYDDNIYVVADTDTFTVNAAIVDVNVSVAARYKAYNSDNQAYGSVTSTLPTDLGATYTVNGSSTATVTKDTPVTLAASTSSSKYEFVGWYSDANCTTTVSSTSPSPSDDTTYYALYQQKTSTLTYNVVNADGSAAPNGAKINNFTNGTTKNYAVGSEISVSAAAVTGYTSKITATGATLSSNKITIGTTNATVTATYTINSHNVTYTASDNGSFTTAPTSANYNSTVTVVVTPNPGYKVDTVKYGSQSANVTYNGDVATATFTMPDSDVTVSATYSKKSYTISDNSTAAKGSVTTKVNGTAAGTFNIGDTLTFEPTAQTGYKWTSYTVTFANGTSKTVNNGSSYSVTIDADTIGNLSVVGNFTEDSYTITYVGENCTKPTNAPVEYNSTVSISGFSANKGYAIAGYKVFKTGDPNTVVTVSDDNTFTMPAYPVTISAIVKKQYSVSVTTDGNGSVSPATATVLDGETIELSATANSGYAFDSWTLSNGATLSSGALTNKKITVTVTSDVTINATFKEASDIVIYLATKTSWDQWQPMSVTNAISDNKATTAATVYKTGDDAGIAVGCDGGKIGIKNVNGEERYVSYIVLPGECATWTEFYIGNANGTYFCSQKFSGAPQYGYCYYNTSTDAASSCAATTISNPKANNVTSYSCYLEDNPTINLTSTVTKANTSSGSLTAGGTTYHVQYIINSVKTRSTEELDDDVTSWTPSEVGTYTVTAKLHDDYTTFYSEEVATITVSNKTLYDITYTNPSDGTIKITNADGTEITQAYAGQTVKVVVSPNVGYKCTGVSITPTTEYTGSNGTYSFTMPAQAVTVSATVAEKALYTVKAVSNNDAYGSVSPTGEQKVYEGDTVTLKASPSSTYSFVNWTISGSAEYVGCDANSATITIKVNSNITATANFSDNTYKLDVNDTKTNMVKLSNSNYYISTVTVATGNSDNLTSKRFTIYNTSTGKYAISTASGSNSYWFITSNANSWAKVSDWNETKSDNQYLNNLTSAKYVLFDPTANDGAGAVKLVDTETGASLINVYAKNGTVPYNSDDKDKGTAKYGVTEVTKGYTGANTSTDSRYKLYTASNDGTVTLEIKTTVNSSYHTAGYYVEAFVINGETYKANNDGNGVYSASYKIPAGSGDIEITPVYFNNNIKDAEDYITVYVDASDLDDLWGNTVSCYTYYNINGTDGPGMDCAYPGQPLLKDTSGKYYTMVSRYYYNANGVKDSNSPVTGVTFANYYYDSVHQNFLTEAQSKNYQTYDYDDFKYISDPELHYDTVKFTVKYRTETSNQSTLNNGNTGATKTGSVDLNTFKNDTHNGFDTFTNYDNEATDILGNEVDSTKSPIYIVSTGNQKTDIGKWSTMWYVYDSNGNYITQGAPSDFIARPNSGQQDDPNTTAYKAIVAKDLVGSPTYICYESQMDGSTSVDTGTNGIRVDGRWYYVNSTAKQVTVNMAVQYSTDDGEHYDYDTDGSTGSVAYIDGETQKTFDVRNTDATINAVAGNGYLFVGWYKIDDNGNIVKLDTSEITATFKVDSNYTLIARFNKVEDTTLIISHRKYSETDAGGGAGYYYVTAVLNANGVETPYTNIGTTSDNVQVPLNIAYDPDATLTITLRTDCVGFNNLIDWYEKTDYGYQIIGPEDVDEDNANHKGNTNGDGKTVSYTFTIDVADLYNGSQLMIQNLRYFSDINPVSANAVLKYKYTNRYGEERIYVKNVTLSDDYIANNKLSLDCEDGRKLVYENSPAVDDLYNDCIWNITDQEYNPTGTTVTLVASQPEKTYKVTLDYNDGNGQTESGKVSLGSYFLDVDGNFYNAPETNKAGDKFSYWIVYDADTNAKLMECYNSSFNLYVTGDIYIKAIYGEEIKADVISISDAIYSREQYTNSSGTVTSDYLYADFTLAYRDENKTLLSESNYKTGLIVEFDRYITVYKADEVGYTLTESEKKQFTDEQNAVVTEETLKSFINTGNASKIIDGHRALYNYEIDNSNYTNKNRIDFYLKFQNTSNFRHYVMKAYYYVVDDQGNIKISDPVYFYLYDIGNSETTTNKAS